MGRCGGDRLIVHRCGGNPSGFRCPPRPGNQASRESPGPRRRCETSQEPPTIKKTAAACSLPLSCVLLGVYVHLFLNPSLLLSNSSRSMSVMSQLLHSHPPLHHHHHLLHPPAHHLTQRRHHHLLAYLQPLSLLLLLCMRLPKSHCRLYSR
jgi:hypothetical protein